MNKILKSNSNVLKITFERNSNVNIRRLDNVIDTNQIKSTWQRKRTCGLTFKFPMKVRIKRMLSQFQRSLFRKPMMLVKQKLIWRNSKLKNKRYRERPIRMFPKRCKDRSRKVCGSKWDKRSHQKVLKDIP